MRAAACCLPCTCACGTGTHLPATDYRPIQTPTRPNSGSTFGNKGAWAAAVGAVDPAEGTKVEKEKDWRHKYTKCVPCPPHRCMHAGRRLMDRFN